jgi:16S rRNA (guanine(966)-N(2))-methyltransferase RsmD
MRIIGGRVGGRTIRAPRGEGTRPTSDKVREAIFNFLVARSDPPAHVLDLYAGSGALGLEALSRGAGAATFVDADGDACDLVRDNAHSFGFSPMGPSGAAGGAERSGTIIVCSPVVRWLAKSAAGGSYGWIFLDPPYDSHRTGELDKALDLLARKSLLAPGGVAVAEHEWRHPPDDVYPGQTALALFDRRRYGQTEVSFYRRQEEPDVSAV